MYRNFEYFSLEFFFMNVEGKRLKNNVKWLSADCLVTIRESTADL